MKQNPDGPLVLLPLSIHSAKLSKQQVKAEEDRTIIKHKIALCVMYTLVTNPSSSSTPSPYDTASKLTKRVEYMKYTYTKGVYPKSTAMAANGERTGMKTGHEEEENEQIKTNSGFAVKRRLYSALFPPTLPIQLLG